MILARLREVGQRSGRRVIVVPDLDVVEIVSDTSGAIGDLILAEVLQGFRSDADHKTAKRLLTTLTIFDMLGAKGALESADNFRALRKKGIKVRKTADVIIATFRIANHYSLLLSTHLVKTTVFRR